MKKILEYKGKHENLFYDISTEELKRESFLKLFKYLKEFGCYESLKDLKEPECNLCDNKGKVFVNGYILEGARKEREVTCPDCGGTICKDRQYYKRTSEEKQLYERANLNDTDAAMRLLSYRKNYKYEEWEIHDIE